MSVNTELDAFDYPISGNVATLVDRVADSYPDQEALIDNGSDRTFAELSTRTRSLAGGLRDIGLDAGSRCCVYLPNGVSFVEASLGLAHAGVVGSPINPSYKDREVTYQLKHSDASALISSPENLAYAEKAVTNVEQDVTLIVTDTTKTPLSLKELCSRGNPLHVDTTDDTVAFQPYTSGTTSEPKGVLLTHRNFQVQIAQGIRRILAREQLGDALILLPQYHITGLLVTLTALSAGQRVHIHRPDQWDPVEVLETLDRYPISEFVGVSTMFSDLLDAYEADLYDLSELNAAQQGGTKLPPEVLDDVEVALDIDLMEGYGLTESTGAVLSSIDASLGARRDSAGQPTGHTRVKIIDEDGHEVPDGEVGELLIKGPQIMSGYYNNPGKTAETLTEDGYLRTGDMASRDEDNYVYIKGRKTNMIITGGFNVYPTEVEDTINALSGVRDAVVFGVPDDRKGETVAAVVQPKPDAELTTSAIKEHVLEQLAPYKHPRIVEIDPDLPRTGSGKIQRRSIKDRLLNETE
jgi:long-chain acyl-CoA synthetase